MKKLALSALNAFYSKISETKTLIAPIESAGQVDFGVWSEGAQVRLDVLKTVKSAKGAFFPQVEDMVRFHVQGKNIEIDPAEVMDEDFVIFGVRACDARSFELLDRVFLSDPVDPFYAARRQHGTCLALRAQQLKDSFPFVKALRVVALVEHDVEVPLRHALARALIRKQQPNHVRAGEPVLRAAAQQRLHELRAQTDLADRLTQRVKAHHRNHRVRLRKDHRLVRGGRLAGQAARAVRLDKERVCPVKQLRKKVRRGRDQLALVQPLAAHRVFPRRPAGHARRHRPAIRPRSADLGGRHHRGAQAARLGDLREMVHQRRLSAAANQ